MAPVQPGVPWTGPGTDDDTTALKSRNDAAESSAGGGAVSSVNGRTGAVTGLAEGFIPTAVKTAPTYAAGVNELVVVDTTSNAVTITLPNAPADKTRVAIKHIIQGGTNTVTFQTQGSDVFNKAGGSTSGTLQLLNQAIQLQYKAADHIWYAISNDIPSSMVTSLVYGVEHGSTASAARPNWPGKVIWTGTVQPTNAITGDVVVVS